MSSPQLLLSPKCHTVQQPFGQVTAFASIQPTHKHFFQPLTKIVDDFFHMRFQRMLPIHGIEFRNRSFLSGMHLMVGLAEQVVNNIAVALSAASMVKLGLAHHVLAYEQVGDWVQLTFFHAPWTL
jgi:hypothetical protein